MGYARARPRPRRRGPRGRRSERIGTVAPNRTAPPRRPRPMATASATHTSPLAALQDLGQCVWLDFISREVLDNGELRRMIEEDGLQGVTSNPTIFDKAISH